MSKVWAIVKKKILSIFQLLFNAPEPFSPLLLFFCLTPHILLYSDFSYFKSLLKENEMGRPGMTPLTFC